MTAEMMKTIEKTMPRGVLLPAVLSAGLFGATAAVGDDLKRDAQKAVHRLAALRAMVAFVESPGLFAVSVDELAAQIAADVAAHREFSLPAARRVVDELTTKRLLAQTAAVAARMPTEGTDAPNIANNVIARGERCFRRSPMVLMLTP